MEIARDRARAMGLTIEQAFNDIVTGIGRGSPLSSITSDWLLIRLRQTKITLSV